MGLENFDNMGKKRVIKKSEEAADTKKIPTSEVGQIKVSKKIGRGIAHIRATYNNTLITITDEKGNVIASSSAGALGFSGAKKATPFAAARVVETLAEKLRKISFDEMHIFVKGVGAGRDSSIRSLANRGFNITVIKDVTPLPHNGPRPKKPRRV